MGGHNQSQNQKYLTQKKKQGNNTMDIDKDLDNKYNIEIIEKKKVEKKNEKQTKQEKRNNLDEKKAQTEIKKNNNKDIEKKNQTDIEKGKNNISKEDKKNKDNNLQSCNEEKKEIKSFIPYSMILKIDETYRDITLNKFGVK